MAISRAQAAKATVAFQRFGLGAKRGGVVQIAKDPVAALLAELDEPGEALLRGAGLQSYQEVCAASASSAIASGAIYEREVEARIGKHLEPRVGYVERLVVFWANHFSMSYRKSSLVRGTIGHFEREVIRKHVLGKFSDMFLAALRHPAMISFLDNEMSTDRISEVGIKSGRNYTENLAREMMELHSLGAGNYQERDVKTLSLCLAGWSIVSNKEADLGLQGGGPATRGQFIFKDALHYPLQRKFLGQNVPPGGQEQAETAVAILAAHPATATKIAMKLVRHFITDAPTPEMIEPLAATFRSTGGDLKAVAATLAQMEAAWTAPPKKLRTPYEFLIAQYRALGARLSGDEASAERKILFTLNQQIWGCPSPEGYPDETPYWLSPQAIAFRIDAAQVVAKFVSRRLSVDASLLARQIYASALSAPTKERVAHAGSPLAGLTVLFASPEFQRR